MKKGFTLVELSIVLVILGLLVGGVLAGQSLIRAAELRAVTTEFANYQTAVMTFKEKYFALPGDMTNATAFWGASANCPGTNTQGTTDGTTCNGDGDGRINTGIWSVSANSNESYRMWQHLVNAGLIEGVYDGVEDRGGVSYSAVSDNSPASRLGGDVIWFAWYWDYTGNFEIYDVAARSGNMLIIGAAEYNTWNKGGILSPEEAWNIDTKVDDGVPGTGAILAVLHQGCTLASGPTDYTAGYDLQETSTTACGLMFVNVF